MDTKINYTVTNDSNNQTEPQKWYTLTGDGKAIPTTDFKDYTSEAMMNAKKSLPKGVKFMPADEKRFKELYEQKRKNEKKIAEEKKVAQAKQNYEDKQKRDKTANQLVDSRVLTRKDYDEMSDQEIIYMYIKADISNGKPGVGIIGASVAHPIQVNLLEEQMEKRGLKTGMYDNKRFKMTNDEMNAAQQSLRERYPKVFADDNSKQAKSASMKGVTEQPTAEVIPDSEVGRRVDDGHIATATEEEKNSLPKATFANIADAKVGDKFVNSKGETLTVTQSDITYSQQMLQPQETTEGNAEEKPEETPAVKGDDEVDFNELKARGNGATDDAKAMADATANDIIKSGGVEESSNALAKAQKKAESLSEAFDNSFRSVDKSYIDRLPVTLIEYYNQGGFGNRYAGKKNSELTPEEKDEKGRTRARFAEALLSSLGTGMMNVGNIMQGKEPVAQSIYQKIKNGNLDAAIKDYNNARAAKVDTLMSDIKETSDLNLKEQSELRSIIRDIDRQYGLNKVDADKAVLAFNARKKLGNIWATMSKDQQVKFYTAAMALADNPSSQAVGALLTAIGTDNLSKLAENLGVSLTQLSGVLNSGLEGANAGISGLLDLLGLKKE